MSAATDLDRLRGRAQDALKKLAGVTGEDLAVAKGLVEELRNAREYERMGQLAEAVSRHDPDDPRNRRLYAQYLIDTGHATVAIDVLRVLARRLPADHPERVEAAGLLGRAYKQIFFDAGDKSTAPSRDALKAAIAAYRAPYDSNAANTWHGINLLALLTRARRLGVRIPGNPDPRALAERLVGTLDAIPSAERDEWFLPTRAEASLGLGDWNAVESAVHTYVADEHARAFQVASTLRQFTEIWDLEREDERGRDLVNILRARLAQLPGGALDLTPALVQRLRETPPPSNEQLQAVLGTEGTRTYQWWKTGLDRAVGVAAVRARLGGRIGTGFLVRGADLGLPAGDELLVLTNAHVINASGAAPGIRPDEAEVVFEAANGQVPFPVSEIVWSSPIEMHDATIARLGRPVLDIPPLPSPAPCHCSTKARAYTSSATLADASSRSRSRTTSSSITKAHPRASLRSRACAACTTARRPKVAVPAPPCATPGSGRWLLCTTAAGRSGCAASTARQAPTPPTRESPSFRSPRPSARAEDQLPRLYREHCVLRLHPMNKETLCSPEPQTQPMTSSPHGSQGAITPRSKP